MDHGLEASFESKLYTGKKSVGSLWEEKGNTDWKTG